MQIHLSWKGKHKIAFATNIELFLQLNYYFNKRFRKFMSQKFLREFLEGYILATQRINEYGKNRAERMVLLWKCVIVLGTAKIRV